MTDRERLLRWFDDGTLVRPSAEAPNTVALVRALASLAGADITLDGSAQHIAAAIGEAEHCVFVLADGLGMELLEEQPDGAFLRSHIAMEMQPVFPSTTAAAITSIATGLWPSEHGAPAWWTHLPEHGVTATILPFVERFSKRPLEERGIQVTGVLTAPPLLPRFARDARTYMPRAIAHSSYSRYFTGGTPVEGYDGLRAAADAITARIDSAAGPTYTYLYIPDIDATEHVHGTRSREARAAVDRVDRAVARLAERVAGRARVALSADHGLIDVPPRRRHIVRRDDEIMRHLLAPPYGEPRVPMFAVKPAQSEAFAACFRRRYGDTFALLTTDEAGGLRLFGPGPLGATTRARIGDFLALCATPEVLVYEHADDPMQGYHGGLSPAEMRIPLVVA